VTRQLRQTKIAILTGVSLAHNPRPVKEAMTLARAGFEVVVYGASPNLVKLDVDEALARRHGFSFKSVSATSQVKCIKRLQSIWPPIRTRLGKGLFRYLNMPNRWQLGSCVPELLCAARKANADYYIVHLEQGAWVGARLLNSGYSVGLDIEDWYSEDLLPEAQNQQPLRLLRDLERKLLMHGGHATCPSRAMSNALAQHYKCPPPAVVYNAFPWSERGSVDGLLKDRLNRKVPSIHWFSQTLGIGRGLEDLLAALPHVHHAAEIHLRGKPAAGFESWLQNSVPPYWRDRIFVHDLVSNEELLSRVAEHDIGFAGEMKYCHSRDLTVTNKILYYLLAGLAVIASDTAGQCEVAEQAPDAVLLYRSGDCSALADKINLLLGSRNRLERAKACAIQAAKQTFCWERQENALLETIANALAKQGAHGLPPVRKIIERS
jgi:hypothetical protein